MDAPHGWRSQVAWTPEVESRLSGLPLSDVLTDRARALVLRQTWAEERARDMLADAIAYMDRELSGVPSDCERREDPESVRIGWSCARRWRDREATAAADEIER